MIGPRDVTVILNVGYKLAGLRIFHAQYIPYRRAKPKYWSLNPSMQLYNTVLTRILCSLFSQSRPIEHYFAEFTLTFKSETTPIFSRHDFDIRPHRRRTHAVQSYSAGCANMHHIGIRTVSILYPAE